MAAKHTIGEAPSIAKSIPEIKLGGGYSTRSPINLESSPAPREIPNFASAMAEPSSEAPSFITDLLEPDSLIKRIDELKSQGVLYHPTKRVPRIESLFHGTGNEWAEGKRAVNQAEIDAWHDAASDAVEFGQDPSTLGEPPAPVYAPVSEYAPFSSRKASSSNLHGGPFYLTDAMPVAEGSYAAAGEGQGPNPEIINADVTTNKTWNLDAPVPRDIRVKGLTLLQRLINNEKANVSWIGSDGLSYGKGGASERLNYYRQAYDRLKQARIGRDVESIMSDVIDRSSGGEPIFDRSDNSGLHYEYPKLGLIPKESKSGIPLRQRDIFTSGLSPKDKFLRVLESDLGYDSVKHGSKFTGGEVTIPFSRTQIKTKGAQKVAPLSERSLEGLISEYETLNPNDFSNESLRDALRSELQSRLADMPDPQQLKNWEDPKYREDFAKHLEEKIDECVKRAEQKLDEEKEIITDIIS